MAPSPDVPDLGKIGYGTTRSEIRKRYGVPTLAVVSSHDGSLVERYYYADPDHSKMAIATFRDGKLVAAQTVH